MKKKLLVITIANARKSVSIVVEVLLVWHNLSAHPMKIMKIIALNFDLQFSKTMFPKIIKKNSFKKTVYLLTLFPLPLLVGGRQGGLCPPGI